MDKILMLRKEGHMGARGIYIGMRRQASELGPMRYAYAWPARDIDGLTFKPNHEPFNNIRASRYS